MKAIIWTQYQDQDVMKIFKIPNTRMKISTFLLLLVFFEAHPQTRPDKPLAPPSQAHWQRASREFESIYVN